MSYSSIRGTESCRSGYQIVATIQVSGVRFQLAENTIVDD